MGGEMFMTPDRRPTPAERWLAKFLVIVPGSAAFLLLLALEVRGLWLVPASWDFRNFSLTDVLNSALSLSVLFTVLLVGLVSLVIEACGWLSWALTKDPDEAVEQR
jgi:hypothetical protein